MKTVTFFDSPYDALAQYEVWFKAHNFDSIQVSMAQCESMERRILSIIVVYVEAAVPGEGYYRF